MHARGPATARTLLAPAKLNLCLEVLGKQGDGFHELRSLMTPLRWGDTLRLERLADTDRLRLVVKGPAAGVVPGGQDNLVLRALARLRAAGAVPYGATATLVKRVPSQAGLGGGSSDAAAALVAANELWGLGWRVDRLAEVGAAVGSDVPFFVHAIGSRARAALVEGRGERVRPVPVPGGMPVVILKPGFGLSTREVYAACEPTDWARRDGAGPDGLAAALAGGDWRAATGCVANTLAAAAKRVEPAVETIERAFREAGCVFSELCGSGSAYFGVARTKQQSVAIAARLRALRLGQVWVTCTA